MPAPASAERALILHRLCGFAELVEREGLRATDADLAGLAAPDRAAVTDLLAEVERGLPVAAFRRAAEMGEAGR